MSDATGARALVAQFAAYDAIIEASQQAKAEISRCAQRAGLLRGELRLMARQEPIPVERKSEIASALRHLAGTR